MSIPVFLTVSEKSKSVLQIRLLEGKLNSPVVFEAVQLKVTSEVQLNGYE